MAPVLWGSKHIKHKDKQCIHDGWMRISERMEFSVTELIKRDSLIATYRSYKIEILASMQSRAAADSVYKQIWFDFMDLFLKFDEKNMNTDSQVRKK